MNKHAPFEAPEAPAAVLPVEIPVNPETEKMKAGIVTVPSESSVLRTAMGLNLKPKLQTQSRPWRLRVIPA